jgi:heptosyltransferase-2
VSAPRILLVRFSSLGDVLLTTPLIRALRARHPRATITALTKEACAPLLGANPHLDEVVALGAGQSLVELARALRGANFTHRLDLHASVRSRVLRLLVPGCWTTYDPRRGPRRTLVRSKRDAYHDEVPVPERYFEAATALDVQPDGGPAEFFLSPAAETRADDWLGSTLLPGEAPLAVLAPGAAHATKRWPLEHWQELARRLGAGGWAVAVIGGAGDGPVAAGVAEVTDRAASAAGLDLQAAGALVRRARVLVSGDTAAMHIATAVGTPVVALFGPTVRQFGFFPYHAEARVLERALPCRPCSSKGGPRCPLGHHRCMRDITAREVLAQVKAFTS